MTRTGGERECRLETARTDAMTFTVTTHLNFQGQARAALDFYKNQTVRKLAWLIPSAG